MDMNTLQPNLFSLLTFFAGLFIGHRLAIVRDKRQEFNDAARPIREWLIRQAKHPSAYTQRPSDAELDEFISYLQIWRRRGFRRAYKNLQTKREQCKYRDSFGQVLYSDEASIIDAINKCLPYTKRK
jgi:hypothetical protein